MIKKLLSGLLIIFAMFMVFSGTANARPQEAPHWNKKVINVYIPPKHNKSITMRHAFEKWQQEFCGNMSFNFVQKGPADIDVIFTDKVNGTDGPIGQYDLTIKNGYITKAEIKIATDSKKKYSKNLIYTTMLHEVGHALGLPDEYKKPSSIMHMPITETQDILKLNYRDLYRYYNWNWSQRRIYN